MAQLFKNAARSALAAPIAAADTSLTVDITTADLFPAANTGTDPVGTVGKDWFKVVLEDVNHNIEIVYVRTRTLGSAVMSNLQRGQEGTTAISFATGSVVGLRMTASDMQDAINLAAQATTYGEDLLWAASVDAQVTKLGSALQKQLVQAFTTAGTSTAYTITPTPAITAYAANLSFDVTFNQTCGLNPTLSISGVLTPPNLVKQNPDGTYSNLAAGDVVANHRSRVTLLSATQALVEKLPPKFSAASADIASAATLDLTAVTGEIVRVTGTTATTAVTMNNGQRVKCIAVGAWPLTYHATNLPVQGGASYTCSAGDMIIFTKNGNGDLTIEGVKKDGTPIFFPAATETLAGKVELATSAETVTGTDTERATHAAGVKAAIEAGTALLAVNLTARAAGTTYFNVLPLVNIATLDTFTSATTTHSVNTAANFIAAVCVVSGTYRMSITTNVIGGNPTGYLSVRVNGVQVATTATFNMSDPATEYTADFTAAAGDIVSVAFIYTAGAGGFSFSTPKFGTGATTTSVLPFVGLTAASY